MNWKKKAQKERMELEREAWDNDDAWESEELENILWGREEDVEGETDEWESVLWEKEEESVLWQNEEKKSIVREATRLEKEEIEGVLWESEDLETTVGKNTAQDKQERDEKFTNLFKRYKGLMFWTTKDVLKDEYLAEDALQDAFIKLINRIDQIDDIRSAEAKRYVSAAARNAAIDRYRRRNTGAKQEIFSEDVEYFEEIEAEPCLEESEGNRILDIINALPDTYREVNVLKYVQHMENWEIAAQLNLHEGTVRQKLSRGKALIEKAIRQLEKEEDVRIL